MRLCSQTEAVLEFWRPWYSAGFFTHGSLSGGGVLVGGGGAVFSRGGSLWFTKTPEVPFIAPLCSVMVGI